MKCPGCSHESQKAVYLCPACGQAFDRGLSETLGHLEFLNVWLDENAAIVRAGRLALLQQLTGARISGIRDALLPEQAPAAAPAPIQVQEPVPAPVPAQVPVPALGARPIVAASISVPSPAPPPAFPVPARAPAMPVPVAPQVPPVPAALAAALYFGSAALFRRTGWLYPALLIAHLALATFCSLFPSDAPWYTLSLPFLGMTWAMALVGLAFSRRLAVPLPKDSLLAQLTTASWARPFLAAATVDVVLWQAVALNGNQTAIIVGAGVTLLLALFTFLWLDPALAYGAIALAQVATFFAFRAAGIGTSEMLACFGGIGLGLFFLGRLAQRLAHARLTVWVQPLTRSSIALTALAALTVLPTSPSQPVPTAAALTFAGALYLALAYQGRYNQLGYFVAALVEAAWALVLFSQSIREPQFYAIPAGLYFVAVGYMERCRAKRPYAGLLEGLGLGVLLLTSFVQSLNGAEGFPYFVLLLVEALLVIWWGAARRIRLPFLAGLAASVQNVLAQVVVLIRVNTPTPGW